MGKINQGILGGFTGKVGNVIGGNWKGIDYMRVKPANVANPRTDDQLDQRSRFVTVLQFLQPMKDFIKVGFKKYAIKMTEFNSAMSYNLNNAVTGTYPNFSIDFANALVSRGALAGSLNGTASSATAGNVSFTWDDNSGDGNAKATDTALLLVYNPTKKEAIFITEGVVRTAESQNLAVPDSYSGDTVHAFMGFITADGKEISNSKYVGSLIVAS
jgi:hypothetical protein